MGRKDQPPDGGPPLDPFGANDPYWERYTGVSWIRRFWRPQPSVGTREAPRPRRGEMFSVVVVGGVAIAVLVGAIALLFYGLAALVRLLS
jgi:hypothetical protein